MEKNILNKKGLVILSGGQDSTTVSLMARQHHAKIHAITFDYGQRHRIEIESAQNVANYLLFEHEIISLGQILKSSSPLVAETPLGQYENKESLPGGVEPTFVSGRNILFLTIAANRAHHLGISDIYIGVCQEDFGGYFDCRQEFITKIEEALNEGIYGKPRGGLKIHTPLMNMTKAESILAAQKLLNLIAFENVFSLTHTCYAGVQGGCGKCHACILRDAGFKEAGIEDPIWKHRAVV